MKEMKMMSLRCSFSIINIIVLVLVLLQLCRVVMFVVLSLSIKRNAKCHINNFYCREKRIVSCCSFVRPPHSMKLYVMKQKVDFIWRKNYKSFSFFLSPNFRCYIFSSFFSYHIVLGICVNHMPIFFEILFLLPLYSHIFPILNGWVKIWLMKTDCSNWAARVASSFNSRRLGCILS